MFKNLIVYRIGPDWQPDLMLAVTELAKDPFVGCGASQPMATGWVPPRGDDHAPMVESVANQWLMKLMVEQKVLPASVVKRRSTEIAEQIERETGRKPGKKQSKEIKDQATQELLPMAFTKQAATLVWIDPERRLLMLDAGSASRAEAVVTHLVKAMPGFAVQPFQTRLSPAVAMGMWLGEAEAPRNFSIDRECELKSVDEMKSVVRYARHALDTDEVRQHIALGKQPTRLAMTWAGKVSFVLTDALQIKKIAFDDGLFDGKSAGDKADDAFDADAAISTGELVHLIPDLVEALDGELLPGELPAELQAANEAHRAEAKPRSAAAASSSAPAGDEPASPAGDEPPPWE